MTRFFAQRLQESWNITASYSLLLRSFYGYLCFFFILEALVVCVHWNQTEKSKTVEERNSNQWKVNHLWQNFFINTIKNEHVRSMKWVELLQNYYWLHINFICSTCWKHKISFTKTMHVFKAEITRKQTWMR